MIEPTDKHREAARQLLPASAEFDNHPCVESIATALANLEAEAYARGRGELTDELKAMFPQTLRGELSITFEVAEPLNVWIHTPIGSACAATFDDAMKEIRGKKDRQ